MEWTGGNVRFSTFFAPPPSLTALEITCDRSSLKSLVVIPASRNLPNGRKADIFLDQFITERSAVFATECHGKPLIATMAAMAAHAPSKASYRMTAGPGE
jgi:hypothetical protein